MIIALQAEAAIWLLSLVWGDTHSYTTFIFIGKPNFCTFYYKYLLAYSFSEIKPLKFVDLIRFTSTFFQLFHSKWVQFDFSHAEKRTIVRENDHCTASRSCYLTPESGLRWHTFIYYVHIYWQTQFLYILLQISFSVFF